MACVFVVLAVVGFKKSPWLPAVALIGHGAFDFVHHFFIQKPGVPRWWPAFCLSFDAAFGLWLPARLRMQPQA